MKNILYAIWFFIRKQSLQIEFLGVRLDLMNGFLSILSLKFNKSQARHLFFFSYDPIALQFWFLFYNFTPRYLEKAEAWQIQKKKEYEEWYAKQFERKSTPTKR